jgi:hypothetical protein
MWGGGGAGGAGRGGGPPKGHSGGLGGVCRRAPCGVVVGMRGEDQVDRGPGGCQLVEVIREGGCGGGRGGGDGAGGGGGGGDEGGEDVTTSLETVELSEKGLERDRPIQGRGPAAL